MNRASIARAMVAPYFLWLVAAGASCLWCYWTTLAAMANTWSVDPQYSHGYLVPVFALSLLWTRRSELATGVWQPSWWGLPLVVLAASLRLIGTYFYFPWLDAVSLLPCLAGLCLTLGGKPALRWSWTAIAFLVFMLPLPYRLQVLMGGLLQRMATLASTYLLQAFGFLARAEGNIIYLGDHRLFVEEACSGLSMLMVFFALSTAFALVVRRPLLDRLLILASAVPIALIANVVRITSTSMLVQWGQNQAANLVFHDLAGWLMMVQALVLLGIGLRVFDRLLIPVEAATGAPLPLGARPRRKVVPKLPASRRSRTVALPRLT
jgi:exosortase